MVINYPIGWVVTHVVMALIFYLVVTPLGRYNETLRPGSDGAPL